MVLITIEHVNVGPVGTCVVANKARIHVVRELQNLYGPEYRVTDRCLDTLGHLRENGKFLSSWDDAAAAITEACNMVKRGVDITVYADNE